MIFQSYESRRFSSQAIGCYEESRGHNNKTNAPYKLMRGGGKHVPDEAHFNQSGKPILQAGRVFPSGAIRAAWTRLEAVLS